MRNAFRGIPWMLVAASSLAQAGTAVWEGVIPSGVGGGGCSFAFTPFDNTCDAEDSGSYLSGIDADAYRCRYIIPWMRVSRVITF